MRKFQWTWFTVAALACLVMGTAVSAQDNYSTGQIEQFVAPVALYPDALLAQVFMAATYPGEVVEANAWVQQNPGYQGDALAVALDGQYWDVSVKSLVPFPQVLNRMAVNVAWTQDLGNAFLVQPDEVTNAVQRLRHRSYDAGYLRTSQYQRVMVEQQYIQIMPVGLQLVYVPAYNPMVVYGPGWGYPTYYYPTMMAPPPYYVSGNVISFGVGFAVGAALFGAFDWNHHDVYYGPNFYQYGGYHSNVVDWQRRYPNERPGGHNTWEHNPVHRGSTGYNNPVLQQKYGHATPEGAGHGGALAKNPPPEGHPQQREQQKHPNQQPVAHPQEPATHPREPVAKPPQPVAHPQQQKNPAQQPAAHPQQQKNSNQQPAAHPQQQRSPAQQPVAHPQQQKNPAQHPAAHPQQQQKSPSQQPAAHPQQQKNTNQGAGSNASAKAEQGKPEQSANPAKGGEKKNQEQK